ncbi:phosphoenolpyruvate carboxykinase (ATP)-like [Ananas comosus]|uniref:Phosphoenolpyruvate carboxykinase (ATP)-like n=1 Tax=Ananas comosus TaxID=4615 RepID=A0A6P5FNU6_ANACO|nr:phosphoenolpyruvate carboxykinase (ATP)-like [Ananas comosus]XP_020094765.1 phosphoenolpyruvate carboxykinase (ATP)-like [Ananas comosus]
MEAETGEFTFMNGVMVARNALPRIQTRGGGDAKSKKEENDNGMCHDDSGPTVKAQTIDELHSLQRKRSAPTTPRRRRHRVRHHLRGGPREDPAPIHQVKIRFNPFFPLDV